MYAEAQRQSQGCTDTSDVGKVCQAAQHGPAALQHACMDCMNKKALERTGEIKDDNFCSRTNDSAMKKGCEEFVRKNLNAT